MGEVSGRRFSDQAELHTGDLVASVAGAGRADLTDAQWARLVPLLPRGKKPGRPPRWTKRQLIDGIRWRTRTGTPWRDVPARYGAWQTIYGLFRRWQRAGNWAFILKMLQAFADAAGRIRWQVSVDSTIARAHQHAAGARRDPGAQIESPGGYRSEPADHALGRSRGGWGTKLHLAPGLRDLAIARISISSPLSTLLYADDHARSEFSTRQRIPSGASPCTHSPNRRA
ncbi:IS5 family transposase [Nocardia sp. NPDC052001]|uniref:IS5 family transposase n=1 Tax=Nocardia sp. NPDC052001 TaxID=3154853 RepID=UPI003413DEE4